MFSYETLSEFKAVVILYICAFSIEIDISNSEGTHWETMGLFTCVQVHKWMLINLLSNMVLLRINVVSVFHVIALNL